MVGHTIYHPKKGSAVTSIGMIGHTIYHPGKGSALISNNGRTRLPPCQKGSALTSDHGRTHLPPCQKGSALTSDPVKKALHLYLTMWEPIPQSYQNGSALISDHVGANPIVIS